MVVIDTAFYNLHSSQISKDKVKIVTAVSQIFDTGESDPYQTS